MSPISTLATEAVAVSDVALAPERQAHSRNLLQLIQMRWLAVVGQLLTVLVVHFVLDIQLPLVAMLSWLAVLAAFNVVNSLRLRLALPVSNGELLAGLLVDVGVLSCQLYYAGGSGNPFIYLFLLQVVVGAVVLRPRYVWTLVGITSGVFMMLTQWHRPLVFPDATGHASSPYYVAGLVICFLINAAMLVIFIGRIGRNLRQRDAKLADLRQRAAEEEHIVRMGLLATGAAHELGTPLATLSVILGDWARMTPFAAEPELREEIEQMQLQVQRCKAIVTGILQSAGESRVEDMTSTTLHDFLDEVLVHWQRTRAVNTLTVEREALENLHIVSDSALKQMIDNVLDNALEACPGGAIRVLAESTEDSVVFKIQDEGPGFSAHMRQHFGKPYESTKGRAGGGMGLFLCVNVARTLGGRIEVDNLPGRGAQVTITLPIDALLPSE